MNAKQTTAMESRALGAYRRPRRRLPWWSALIGSSILLLVLAYLGYEWHLDREYRAAIEEADRLDPGWRLADLEAARPVIPDKENAALQVLDAHRLLLPGGWSLTSAGAIIALQEEIDKLSPEVPLPTKEMQRLKEELAKVSPAVTEARRLANIPQGRYVFTWSPDAITTAVPYGRIPEDIARLLALDATRQAQDGNIEGALASVRAVLNTGRSVGDEPMDSSQRFRLICQRFALRGLEHALAQGTASEATLAEIERLLEDEADQPLLLIFARAQRAEIHQFLEEAEAGRFNRASYAGISSPTGSNQADDFLDQAKARSCHAAYLRYLNQCVEIAKLPPEQQIERLKNFDQRPPSAVPQLLWALSHSYDFKSEAPPFHSGLAFLRCAVAANAVERFRLSHGRWPDGLEDVIPAYLSKIPIDPFDGQPLRFRRLQDGVLIYTVGKDVKFYAHQRVRSKPGAPDVDLGFQLWDSERRR
jgi:hypothetical protein